MARELEALNIRTKVSRDSTDLDYWLPDHNHPDLDRPITSMLMGFVKSGGLYYPVDMDLTAKQTNSLFVVGDTDSGKDDFLKLMLQFQGERTSEGYLHVNMILKSDNPYELDKAWGIKRHLGKNSVSYAPEGKIAQIILANLVRDLETKQPFSLKKDNPKLLVIDDLGHFFRNGRPENITLLKRVLNYKGPRSFATVCLVDDNDLDDLTENGFSTGEKTTPGIWLIGKSIATEETNPNFPPGYFMQWSPSRQKLGTLPLQSFTKRK